MLNKWCATSFGRGKIVRVISNYDINVKCDCLISCCQCRDVEGEVSVVVDTSPHSDDFTRPQICNQC